MATMTSAANAKQRRELGDKQIPHPRGQRRERKIVAKARKQRRPLQSGEQTNRCHRQGDDEQRVREQAAVRNGPPSSRLIQVRYL